MNPLALSRCSLPWAWWLRDLQWWNFALAALSATASLLPPYSSSWATSFDVHGIARLSGDHPDVGAFVVFARQGHRRRRGPHGRGRDVHLDRTPCRQFNLLRHGSQIVTYCLSTYSLPLKMGHNFICS